MLEVNLKEFLRELEVEPKGIHLFNKRACIRASSKECLSSGIRGERGLCIFNKAGPTRAFLPALRKFVSKVEELSYEDMLSLMEGKNTDLKDGFHIVGRKGMPYFLVLVEGKKAKVF